jgi:hypothetical protein
VAGVLSQMLLTHRDARREFAASLHGKARRSRRSSLAATQGGTRIWTTAARLCEAPPVRLSLVCATRGAAEPLQRRSRFTLANTAGSGQRRPLATGRGVPLSSRWPPQITILGITIPRRTLCLSLYMASSPVAEPAG